MKLTYEEVAVVDMLLATLDTCDYMGIAPKLTEENTRLLLAMQRKTHEYLMTWPE